MRAKRNRRPNPSFQGTLNSDVRHTMTIANPASCSEPQYIGSLLGVLFLLGFVGYNIFLALMLRVLRLYHEPTFNSLGRPKVLGFSSASPPDYSAPHKLLIFICSTRYRNIDDRRVSLFGHLALACIILFFGSLVLIKVLL